MKSFLAADLQCPARIRVLLRGVVRFIGPDFTSGFPGLDRLLFGIGVAVFRRRNQAGIHNLPGHGNLSLLVKLPVERLHHPLERAGLGQPVAKVPDGVLVRRWRAQVETEKPHLGEPIPDHEFHSGIAQIVLCLQDQRLEHRHRIERWPPAFRSVAIPEPLDQPASEILEIQCRIENLQGIAVLAERLKVIRKTEKN